MDTIEKSLERINEIGSNDISLIIIKGIESALSVHDLINKTSVKYDNNTSIQNVISEIKDEIRDQNNYGFFENKLKFFCFIDKKISITDIIFNNYSKNRKINVSELQESLKNVVIYK